MPSKTEIVNLALGHLSVGKEIGDFETEQSEEARTARRFYNTALGVVVVGANWPFLTKIAALALVEEEPNTEWGYAYRYPSDCAHFRRILSGVRNDARQTRSPHRIAQDNSGKLIFSDETEAEAEYTVKATDIALYPDDFIMTFSLYLAGLMAPKLTKGDQFKLGERAFKLYAWELARVTMRVFNEQQDEEEPEAESIRVRD